MSQVRGWALLPLSIAACHAGRLVGVSGSLAFSSPDQPAAVQQLDAGLVRINFGPFAVNSTKTLILSAESISGTSVTLGGLTPLEPDSEFQYTCLFRRGPW